MSELAATQWTGSTCTPGWSDEAAYVKDQSYGGMQQLRGSFTLGEDNRAAKEELLDVSEECTEPDWDGYGAKAVESDTYRNAFAFIDALPPGYPKPEIDADPDGCLSFGWHRSGRYTLSVSIGPDNDLYWAALLGASKRNGCEPFLGAIPAEVLKLISAIANR